MNANASSIAQRLVESRTYLTADIDRPSVLDWIAELAREDRDYARIQSVFNGMTSEDALVNSEGHRLASEFGRLGYELGVQVGLQLRATPHPDRPRMPGRVLRMLAPRRRHRSRPSKGRQRPKHP
jgi:hypothetical protein